jgi:hypothetical protein
VSAQAWFNPPYRQAPFRRAIVSLSSSSRQRTARNSSGIRIVRKDTTQRAVEFEHHISGFAAEQNTLRAAAANPKEHDMSLTDKSSPKSTYEPICWNFKLLAQHELDGFGGMGEGMAVQIAPGGRRLIWLAHESAPKNFTAVDVSDPRQPKVVVQTDLPQSFMRSNSLEITGNVMAVAYQTQKVGSGEAQVNFLCGLLGRILAWRAPALVL